MRSKLQVRPATQMDSYLLWLSKDTLQSNPHLSIICMQACLLAILDGPNADFKQGLEDFADLSLSYINMNKEWQPLQATDTESIEVLEPSDSVPPLTVLSKQSLTRAFIRAARSTTEMQSLLEKIQGRALGISLAGVVIAIAIQLSPRYNKKHLLIGFLKNLGVQVSAEGSMSSSLGSIPSTMGREIYLELLYALHESAKHIYETKVYDDSTEAFHVEFFIHLAFNSATQIAFHTGYQSFACEIIHSAIKTDNHFCLLWAKTFVALFDSGSTQRLQMLTTSLLSAFLNTTIKRSNCYHDIPEDISDIWPWIAVAYMQHTDVKAEEAGAALANHIMSIDPPSKNDDKLMIDTLWKLASLDSSNEPYFYQLKLHGHTMSSFARSDERPVVTEHERQQMIAAYVETIVPHLKLLNVAIIAECVRVHSSAKPSFWALTADEVEDRLRDKSALLPFLSKRNLSL